jgi:hypothetical protein
MPLDTKHLFEEHPSSIICRFGFVDQAVKSTSRRSVHRSESGTTFVVGCDCTKTVELC